MACSVLKNRSTSSRVKPSANGYDKILLEREEQAANKTADSLGILLNKIDFRVKTDSLGDFKDGFIPWISLESPENDLIKLLDKDQIVLNENKVTVIIDYPLTKEYRFTIVSDTGFTKARLVREISNHYHQLYREEEATAIEKTTPAEKRTTLYNRNQTNGKYGIWGHDIADLVLTEILIYKASNGDILLSLNIES